MTDRKVDIKIKIGGYPLDLRVGLDGQDRVRQVEEAINTLYAKWHERFPQKPDVELMAMLTYQYASFYFAMRDRETQLTRSVKELCGKVQESLAGTPSGKS